VGGYVVEGVLGEGGMGVVYEAWQPSLQRKVALKLIDPRIAGDPSFKTRFEREAVAQAAITHPNIVPVYEIGDGPEGLFLAMQLVRGATLKDLIHMHALPPRKALELLAPIAAAIDAAHAAGLIHRDIKPANVLVTADWHPYLTDFGITKALDDPSVTRAGSFVGTPAYAAPEQIGGSATESSDIYALGATLYECLTQRQPFWSPHSEDVLRAHLEQPPPRPSAVRAELPPTLDTVIEHALAKHPRDRPPTAGALLAEAAQALDGDAIEVTTTTPVIAAQPAPAPPSGHAPERRQLLSRVWQSYTAFLDQTLGAGFHVALPLELVPDLTRRPSDRILPTPRVRAKLPADASVADVFARTGGVQGDGLLVLGAPGAGKTTAVVELASDLARRADHDEGWPVPVYVPLSSWGASRVAFEEWLAGQIHRLYKLSPAAARRALDVDSPYVVLVLDGLDEIAEPDARLACVKAVNAFAAGYPLPVVLTSRQAEYEALSVRVELETAVLVGALDPHVVLERLRGADEMRGVLAVIERDATLLELLTSPLLVSMLTIAYSGREPSEIPAAVSLARLIDDFVDRRYAVEARAGPGAAAYSLERTRGWLALLAAGLSRRQQTIFVLERIRADLLPSARDRRLVHVAPKAAYGLIAGAIVSVASYALSRQLGFRELPAAHVVIWLVFGICAGLVQGWPMRKRLPVWLALGFACGVPYRFLIDEHDPAGLLYQALYHTVFFGLVGELLIRLVPDDLAPAERLSWAWSRARPYVLRGLLIGIVAGPIFGLLFGLTLQTQGASVSATPYWALAFGPLFGLLWAFCRGVGRALMPAPRTVRTRPNEGIRQSARYALMVALTTFVVVQLVTAIGVAIWSALAGGTDELGAVIVLSVAWGCGSGSLLGMACGGGAVVQHWTIRVLLWRAGLAPLRLARWLTFVVRLRVLYWGVGGGHMFIHRLLLEHFASIQRRDLERSGDAG
jgi:hypothetical protein